MKYAVCTDNIGSYSCRCKEGFGGDARKKCLRKLVVFEGTFINKEAQSQYVNLVMFRHCDTKLPSLREKNQNNTKTEEQVLL